MTVRAELRPADAPEPPAEGGNENVPRTDDYLPAQPANPVERFRTDPRGGRVLREEGPAGPGRALLRVPLRPGEEGPRRPAPRQPRGTAGGRRQRAGTHP